MLDSMRDAARHYFAEYVGADIGSWKEALAFVGITSVNGVATKSGVLEIACYGRIYHRLIA